ncbi:MAG TPA: DUF3105 domain-containing protein [Candidatus Dormibacteraeota bacterium]|nr:DUF3105 domain-containing protein [Candidatus Dormibacteraeota bacterium]
MAKKNTAKQARLDERAAQIRSQVEAERRRTNIIIAVFVVVILGGAGVLYFLVNPPQFGPRAALTTGKPVGSIQTIPDEGRGHAVRPTRVTYKHQPPSSGEHYSDQAAPRPWGNVQTELMPEEFVHNLEHGGIDLVYQCSGSGSGSDCDNKFQAAQALMDGLPKEPGFNEVKFLATPYQAMGPKAALLAWDHEWDFNGVPTLDDAKTFYSQFIDKGPEQLK